jgi:hypothetical protein
MRTVCRESREKLLIEGKPSEGQLTGKVINLRYLGQTVTGPSIAIGLDS